MRLTRALAICCSSLVACSGGGGDDAPSDRVPPTVVNTSPSDGASDMYEPIISATFDEEMAASSLGGSAFTVSKLAGGVVPGTVTCAGSTATFTPEEALEQGTTYRATIRRGATDLAGNSIVADQSWTFTTSRWRALATAAQPTSRSGHTAVWTGSELIVWGGTPATLAGGGYDPEADTWTATGVQNAPSSRTGHAAVWTGSRMIVWGGTAGANGGSYDPAADTWTAVSTTNAPAAHDGHVAVWADAYGMLVWGGTNDDATIDRTGARYDPATDTWTTIAAPPEAFHARTGASAVWTGTRMIVWGGWDLQPEIPGGGAGIGDFSLGDGASYDPSTDTWTSISSTLAPSARRRAAAVWTGSELILWGGMAGWTGSPYAAEGGARYRPDTDTWIEIAAAGAPDASTEVHLAWTGDALLVLSEAEPAAGGRYDPDTDGWTAMSVNGAPGARAGGAAVWSGTELLVWGGTPDAAGGGYRP